eukprot:gene13293-15625_t
MTSRKQLELYGATTPNVAKVYFMLKQLNEPFEYKNISIKNGDQFTPEFVKINPNSKVPAIVDFDDKGEPIPLFESGNILLYLANKHHKFIPDPKDVRAHSEVVGWLFWQMASLGPNLGTWNHFHHYAPEQIEYAKNRYHKEVQRLFKVLESELEKHKYVGSDSLSVADFSIFPWIKYASSLPAHGVEQFPKITDYIARLRKEIPSTADWEALEAAEKAKATPMTDEEKKILFGIDKK